MTHTGESRQGQSQTRSSAAGIQRSHSGNCRRCGFNQVWKIPDWGNRWVCLFIWVAGGAKCFWSHISTCCYSTVNWCDYAISHTVDIHQNTFLPLFFSRRYQHIDTKASSTRTSCARIVCFWKGALVLSFSHQFFFFFVHWNKWSFGVKVMFLSLTEPRSISWSLIGGSAFLASWEFTVNNLR